MEVNEGAKPYQQNRYNLEEIYKLLMKNIEELKASTLVEILHSYSTHQFDKSELYHKIEKNLTKQVNAITIEEWAKIADNIPPVKGFFSDKFLFLAEKRIL